MGVRISDRTRLERADNTATSIPTAMGHNGRARRQRAQDSGVLKRDVCSGNAAPLCLLSRARRGGRLCHS